MRIAYFILPPLLLLGGCATTGMGAHAHGGQGHSMGNCPMAASPAVGDQQHGGGDRAGQMMGEGQMMQGMGAMANCPMAQGAAAAPPPTTPSSPPPPPSTDPHQH